MSNESTLTLEFLKRAQNITEAFERKQEWGFASQLLKIHEECAEVQLAFGRMDMENLKEEVCDVILASLTLLHKLDVSPEETRDAMSKTLRKAEIRCGVLEI